MFYDFDDIGLTGLRIPEEFGGQAASAVVAGLAAEEVGRADFKDRGEEHGEAIGPPDGSANLH